jgi:hypothetical protein
MTYGIIRGVQETLRNTLADCYQWQHWQGNNFSRSQALARIYVNALPPPPNGSPTHSLEQLNILRPFALVYTDPDGGFVVNREAVAGGFCAQGKLVVCIEQQIPDSILNDVAAVDDAMLEDLELLISSGNAEEPGLVELADLGGYLIPHRIAITGPVRTDFEDLADLGEAQRVWLEITWGFGR